MSWLSEPLASLDTETTGIDPMVDRLITCSIGYSTRPGVWHPLNHLVNPGVPIPPESTAVHGITQETVDAEGAEPAAALAEIADYLDDLAEVGTPLVIFNAPYDATLLDTEFRRHLGREWPTKLLVIDVLCLFRRFDWTTGGRSLGKLAGRHGIVFPAHDAEADALASLRLLHILGGMNDVLPLIEPTALHEAQIGWWAQQQDIAEANALGNGNHFTRQPHWPLIPMEEA